MSTRVPKNQRAKRALKEREAKLVENVKSSVVLKGPKCSEMMHKILKDLHMMKKPDSKMMQRRNMTRPFEDPASVEFLGKANDCSLFAYGSHSKKRPHNLVFGRMFDFQVLDMLELGVKPETCKSMKDFEGANSLRVGSKPMFLFQGDAFERSEKMSTFKSVVLDWFRGEVVDKINLAGLDRVIVCTAVDGDQVLFRQYSVVLKKSGTKLPRVELREAGPRLDLAIRRTKEASEGVRKDSMRTPRAAVVKLQKNIEVGPMGDRVARVHMKKQDFTEINIMKTKALKRRRKDTETQAEEARKAQRSKTQ